MTPPAVTPGTLWEPKYPKGTLGHKQQWWRARKDKAVIVAWGWPHQCYCGEMEVRRYRGRFYCGACGRRDTGSCLYKREGKPCSCQLTAKGDPRWKHGSRGATTDA